MCLWYSTHILHKLDVFKPISLILNFKTSKIIIYFMREIYMNNKADKQYTNATVMPSH